MSVAIDVFPKRPLALAKVPGRAIRRVLLLLLAILLALPALYWGNITLQRSQLQQDLRARGVRADEVIDLKGDCYSRRNRYSGIDRPIDCWLAMTYRLRTEHGGAVLTTDVHLDGAMPIFTPAAFYDPLNPTRAMLKPEMDRSLGWDETYGPALLLLPSLITLLVFFLTARRGLARAARDPKPIIVPIEKMIRQPGRLYIHIRVPGSDKIRVDSFANPLVPLLVRPPPGAPPDQPWTLALLGSNGRGYALDDQLSALDLTPVERARVLEEVRIEARGLA